ncbi:MAG: TOMM precursor leader peptide-binding protein [Acetobacteraceae bacterium]
MSATRSEASGPASGAGGGQAAETPTADRELKRLLGQLFDPNIGFPDRPVFVQDLDAFEMPDGLGFQFRGLEAPIILRGESAGAVVAHLRAALDGRLTREEVVRAGPPSVPATAFVRALLLLHSKGLLVAADPPPSRPAVSLDGATLSRQLLYWGRHLGITRSAGSAPEIERRLEMARLILIGGGMFGAATCDLLGRSGFRHLEVLGWNDDGAIEQSVGLSPQGPIGFRRMPTTAIDPALKLLRDWIGSADLLVTATTDAPARLFEGINELALMAARPWLYGNADGSALDIGPLVLPYETGCFACLDLRRKSAREFAFENEFHEERLATERDAARRVLAGEAVWPASLGASLLVGEACRLITGLAPPTLTDTMLQVLPVTGTMEWNRFNRVPRCPACYRGAIPAAEVAC